MARGTRNLKYWVLEPSGFHTMTNAVARLPMCGTRLAKLLLAVHNRSELLFEVLLELLLAGSWRIQLYSSAGRSRVERAT